MHNSKSLRRKCIAIALDLSHCQIQSPVVYSTTIWLSFTYNIQRAVVVMEVHVSHWSEKGASRVCTEIGSRATIWVTSHVYHKNPPNSLYHSRGKKERHNRRWARKILSRLVKSFKDSGDPTLFTAITVFWTTFLTTLFPGKKKAHDRRQQTPINGVVVPGRCHRGFDCLLINGDTLFCDSQNSVFCVKRYLRSYYYYFCYKRRIQKLSYFSSTSF